MTKTLNQIFFFFPPPKSEYFFQQHWESEYFFRKKTIIPPPPFKLNGRSLTDLFENIFHTLLCAFRKGHGCQTTLLRLLEDWKTALDKNQYVAAILMDLSNAFDCLPPL